MEPDLTMSWAKIVPEKLQKKERRFFLLSLLLVSAQGICGFHPVKH